ncbi:MAG: hypothetical protein V5A41_14555 [Haloarculaceae archaeon]
MTGDRGDRDRTTAGTDRAWYRDLRDRSDEAASPLAEASRLRDIASSRTTETDTGVPAPDTVAPSTTDDADSASPLIADIRRVADVDDLRLDGSPTDHHYGRVVPTRARVDGRSCRLQLRLFRRPEAETGSGFEATLADQLDRWAAVGDCEGVVPVLDTAGDPRPWSCTAPITATLAERPPTTLADALRAARSLTHTLATVHDRGTLHTGLDPNHVVYAPGTDRPLLDSVGLFDVYRRHTDPSSALALPYAPPEYFDDRYGVADRTTDVYGMGALLYRIFTGRDPYDGPPADIREQVLTQPFPTPSDVTELPEALDDIVARATATDKFDRYQSAATLFEDVNELCLWLLDE